MMVECSEHLILNPDVEPIESGVRLHWMCCDNRVALQRSTPFRLYPEFLLYYHAAALEMKNGEHV